MTLVTGIGWIISNVSDVVLLIVANNPDVVLVVTIEPDDVLGIPNNFWPVPNVPGVVLAAFNDSSLFV